MSATSHICLTNQCGEGESGRGRGSGGAAGVNSPLDGTVGPAVGRDTASHAICRVVDDVAGVEVLPVVGTDTGCGG